LQNQFINRGVEKSTQPWLLAQLKREKGQIKTLIGRAKTRQAQAKGIILWIIPIKNGKERERRDSVRGYQKIQKNILCCQCKSRQAGDTK
jgi:hypothetical protein